MRKKQKKSKVTRTDSSVGAAPKSGFVSGQAGAFKNSFSAVKDKAFWRAMVFDAIFLVSIFLVMILANFLINKVSEPLLPEMARIADLRLKEDPAYADAFAAIEPDVVKVIWQSLGVMVASYLLIVALVSWLYARAWAIIKKDAVDCKKSFLLNLAWFSAWMLLIILTLAIFTDKVAPMLFLVEVMLWFYLDFVFRASQSSSQKLVSNITGTFKLFFSKLHYFIGLVVALPIAYFIMFAALGAVVEIDWLFFPLLLVLNLAVLGFARVYSVHAVNEAK